MSWVQITNYAFFKCVGKLLIMLYVYRYLQERLQQLLEEKDLAQQSVQKYKVYKTNSATLKYDKNQLICTTTFAEYVG